MKLILSLTFLWVLGSTEAELSCLTCVNQQCSNAVSRTCNMGELCVSAASEVSGLGTNLQQIIKSCAPSELCAATGTQAFSVNLGFLSVLANVSCCDSNNCNSQNQTFLGAQMNNSLECYSCNSTTDTVCRTKLQCRGVENRCFNTRVTISNNTSSFLGCASQNACSAADSAGDILAMQTLVNISTATTCCSTDLCNSVTTISGSIGIIPLLLGLLIFSFY
ncbi:uncharacterized protein LOC115042351 [Echeneis naucrates]|uniref:uncharacterized protein LOC115042351 n=1 Tax=Echeneis naucrates TaxID=173247 RepID=UPI001113B193|nr:uncharacterized protein LOC115042351 [Echeneis naucrates]